MPRAQKRRRTKDGERGFALLGVILMVAVMVAAVGISLRGSTDSLRENGMMRSSELAQAAITEGYNQAVNRLNTLDPTIYLSTPANNHDIFNSPAATPFTTSNYPNNTTAYGGNFQESFRNEFTVQTGVILGQRTKAPSGEDVRNAYGYVVEIQIRAAVSGTGIGGDADERVTIGVQVPQQYSHSK